MLANHDLLECYKYYECSISHFYQAEHERESSLAGWLSWSSLWFKGKKNQLFANKEKKIYTYSQINIHKINLSESYLVQPIGLLELFQVLNFRKVLGPRMRIFSHYCLQKTVFRQLCVFHKNQNFLSLFIFFAWGEIRHNFKYAFSQRGLYAHRNLGNVDVVALNGGSESDLTKVHLLSMNPHA